MTFRTFSIDDYLKCCSSTRWARLMSEAPAFATQLSVFERAESAFDQLSDQDWLEAFLGHPRIGDMATLRVKYSSTREWSSNEQSGADGASEEVLERLKTLNDDYYDKNGFIFIVCATGLSASKMLARLEERLKNDRQTEIKNASIEQRKITRIRLEKLT